MSIRVRFDADLETASDQGPFPKDTIRRVYLVNRDGCTFGAVDVSAEGRMSVDFEMCSKTDGVLLTDRLKMHFYFKDAKDLQPVCAGHIPLLELADMLTTGGSIEVKSNFTSNRVTMRVLPNAEHSLGMHTDLLSLYRNNLIVESVLNDSAKHNAAVHLLGDSITAGLTSGTEIDPSNGGPLFKGVKSAHVMQDEFTLYSLYYLDFKEEHKMPPALCTYGIAETMQHLGVTIEQVRAMNMMQVTDFLAAYATYPMRSASAVPYTPDRTLNENPKILKTNPTMLSELFKRPYSNPYNNIPGSLHGNMMTDDCEGLAVIPTTLTNHLAHVYNTHKDTFYQNGDLLGYNRLMDTYFPKEQFALMDRKYQRRLFDEILWLGELVAQGKIECKNTIVAASAPSADAAASGSIQGHACACMVCNDPASPHTVILEGTACIVDDHQTRILHIAEQPITIADVANILTESPGFDTFNSMEKRSGMHITHSRNSFYRTAFCQNDLLLGTHIEGRDKPVYGVDMQHVANDDIKVYMPVRGSIFENSEYEQLKEYVIARREEIHPPLLEASEVYKHLNWVPIAPMKATAEWPNKRKYTTCVVHVLAKDDESLAAIMAQASSEAEAFNANPNNALMGRMLAFQCMDGVSKVLHLYTDDTRELERRLTRAQ